MTFFDAVRNALLAGFGIQEKVSEFINELVKKGELSESQGAKLVREWSEKADKSTEQFSKNLSEIITRTMEKMAIPTRDDVEKLNKKIQALSARVKKLEGSKSESTRGEEEGPIEE
jgi:polyhydroxyalkanoate synthesis regulator phasin